MRILNLAREFPYFPGGHGGNTRAFCLIRELSRHHRFTVVTNVYAPAHEAAAETLRRYVERLEYYRDPAADGGPTAGERPAPPGLLARARDLPSFAVDQLRGLPAEVRLWERSFRNIRPAVQRVLGDGPYDVLQIEYTENAGWARRVPFRGPKVLVVHDVNSVVWWRRSRAARSWAERLRALDKTLRFYRFERRHCRSFDHLVAMSEVDARLLRRLTGHESIVVVPNGVDTGYYRPQAAAEASKRVVFAATMNHPPNRDAILWFADTVWPLVRAAEPDAALDVVGSNPPEDVRALAGHGVRVTGFVPDTRPYLAAARLCVCPLRFASGTRLKVLEAMAMGKPVVSTRIGAEGIDCAPGAEIVVADQPRDLAEQIVRLLRDDAACRRIGAAAERVAARYAWGALARPLDDLYRDAGRRHAARRRARPLRVGWNGSFLVPGGATGGLEPYFHQLVSHLLRLDGDTRYVIIADGRNALEFARHRAENLSLFVARRSPSSEVLHAAGRRLADALLNRGAGTAAVEDPTRGLDLDLVHCFPGYIDPFAAGFPCVLSVADVQHEFHPEFFDAEELAARRALFGPSIERALHVVAISEFTRRSILERYPIDAEKVSVIPLGVSSGFSASGPDGDPGWVRRRFALPEDYCVYPANLWLHKNHPRLLDALRLIPEHERPRLVLTGSATRTQTPLAAAIAERGLGAHVTWLGYVSDRELRALVRGARLMIFPSLFEGFGMPVVEAMAAGCPVACADATALPEVAGDAALLFDPGSADSIAAALQRLWHDAELRGRLRDAGRARARRYTWRRTALLTLQVYRRVGAEVRGG